MAKKQPSGTISFRVDADLLRLIDEARKPFGASPGEWVRGVISNHLQSSGTDLDRKSGVRSALEELVSEQQLTRSGLMRLAYVLLSERGTRTAEEAKEVVQRCFGGQ